MQLRDAKRLWHYRLAAMENQVRRLKHSPEWPPQDQGILRRILTAYRDEQARYYRLIHAQDYFPCSCPA